MEEPESSTWEQPGFDWAGVWVKEGFHWHWRRVNHRASSSRYFLEPLSFLILFSISPLSTYCPWSLSGYLSLLFSFWVVGAVPIMVGHLPPMGGRASVTRGRAPGGQRSLEDRICGGLVKGQKPFMILCSSCTITVISHP